MFHKKGWGWGLFDLCSARRTHPGPPRRLLVLPRARILIILHILSHNFKIAFPQKPSFSAGLRYAQRKSKDPPPPSFFYPPCGSHAPRKTPRQWYLDKVKARGTNFRVHFWANRSNLGSLGVATGDPFSFVDGVVYLGAGWRSSEVRTFATVLCRWFESSPTPFSPLYFPLRSQL